MFQSRAEVVPFDPQQGKSNSNVSVTVISKRVDIITFRLFNEWRCLRKNLIVDEQSLIIENTFFFGRKLLFNLVNCAFTTAIDPELKLSKQLGNGLFIQIIDCNTKRGVILSLNNKEDFDTYYTLLSGRCGYILVRYKDTVHSKPLFIFSKK